MGNLIMFSLLTLLTHWAEIEEREITFIVTVPDSIAAYDTIFITGNGDQLGNWRPDALPLVRVEKNKWQIKIKLPLNQEAEYKFTRGSWNKEEVLADGVIPGNKKLKVLNDQVITHHIHSWRDLYYRSVGGIVGKLQYHHRFYANRLQNERTIIVWLPDSYETDLQKRHPVLYMHDGQNLFDPKTSFIGVDWQMDETADSLIKQKAIEEIIIVGIDNTADRLAEYSDSEKGRGYLDFIIHDLKPFIDSTYRTLPDRKHTAVMGSSMGGLISFYLAWRHPDVFSQAACLSSTFLWNNGVLIKEIENFTGQRKEIRIYFDNGGIGEEGRYTPFFESMKTLLISKGFVSGKDLEYFYDEAGDHSESSWAKRAWRPLKFMFGIHREKQKLHE